MRKVGQRLLWWLRGIGRSRRKKEKKELNRKFKVYFYMDIYGESPRHNIADYREVEAWSQEEAINLVLDDLKNEVIQCDDELTAFPSYNQIEVIDADGEKVEKYYEFYAVELDEYGNEVEPVLD